jgi:hypothetical protein
MHLPTRFLARLGQRFQEILAVNIIEVDVLPPVAAAHDVIHRSGIFNAHLSWHGASAPLNFGGCQVTSGE